MGRHREGAARAARTRSRRRVLGARRHLRLDRPALAHLHPAHRARAALVGRRSPSSASVAPPRARMRAHRRARAAATQHASTARASCSPCRRTAPSAREAAASRGGSRRRRVRARAACSSLPLGVAREFELLGNGAMARRGVRGAGSRRAATSPRRRSSPSSQSRARRKIARGPRPAFRRTTRRRSPTRSHASTRWSSAPRPRSRRSPARRSTPPRPFARRGAAARRRRAVPVAPRAAGAGCSLTMRPGAVTALVGPSGGGKTRRRSDRAAGSSPTAAR